MLASKVYYTTQIRSLFQRASQSWCHSEFKWPDSAQD